MKEKICFLSYILGQQVPLYEKGRVSLKIRPLKSINKGDTCNTYEFTMGNHWGTHIDAPAHFFNKARRISDYKASELVFRNPCIINLRASGIRIIGAKDLKSKVKADNDIVLIKTGFWRLRDKRVYCLVNPMISPQAGLWLRSNRPKVRAIGFDFISLGSCRNKELSRQAHKAFLSPKGKGRPILIIEDMNLSLDLHNLSSVVVAPVLIKNIDSAPCTVLGVFKEN